MSGQIRVTQAGISDRYAADYQYVFNSDWPSLQIAFSGNLTVAAGGTGDITHGLKFFPLTMAWFSVSGVSQGRFYGVTTFDKNKVYIDNTANSSAVTVSVKCYNLDISKTIDYTLLNPPLFKTPYDPGFGIKISKAGKSIASNELRDFILHSRAQSPAVLSIQATPKLIGGQYQMSYTNPANYTPWVLGFYSPLGNDNVYQCAPPAGNTSSPAFFQIGSKSTVWTSGSTGVGSLVVLRDPLVVPTSKRIVY